MVTNDGNDGPDMTGRDEEQDIDVFVSALKARFGQRAAEVAKAQCAEAGRDAIATWQEIYRRLSE